MHRKKGKRMGRPPKAPEDKRSTQVCVRMTVAERARLEADGRKLHLTLSDVLMRAWRKGG